MRTYRSTIWFFASSAIITSGTFSIAAEKARFDVDLKLILAVDVSDSMDRGELQLQRKGYASAFRDPSVARAMASGEIGRIAVLYLEWAGPNHLRVVRPWTVLATLRDALTFADALAMEPIATDSGMSNRAMSFGKSLDQAPIATASATSISASLLLAREKFHDRRFRASRQVIDVSGNGPNNSGPPLAPVRDLLVSEGITINGLPITWSRADAAPFGKSFLERYYEECVIGGPGAFSVLSSDISSFQEAVRLKLLTEIANREILARPVSFEPAGGARIDCTDSEVDH